MGGRRIRLLVKAECGERWKVLGVVMCVCVCVCEVCEACESGIDGD